MTNYVSFMVSTAELAHGEKSRTQSLNHSPSLFDGPGTEAFALDRILGNLKFITLGKTRTDLEIT